MNDLFEFAGGSVVGREHGGAGRNNQDAYYWLEAEECAVAIVCDGCGSGRYSEVGAGLGARLVAHTLLSHMRQHGGQDCETGQCEMHQRGGQDEAEDAAGPLPGTTPFWEAVRGDLLTRLWPLIEAMGDHRSAVVNDYFLFTVVGAIATSAWTIFFALGDGTLLVNDEFIPLGPFEDNAPPYLAYGLVETNLASLAPEMLRFQIKRVLPTAEVQSFLIGTDGVQDLMGAARRNLPGKGEMLGPISQFLAEDDYFANPDKVRRRLAGANRHAIAFDHTTGQLRKEHGLLPDDTTLIVGRKKAVRA